MTRLRSALLVVAVACVAFGVWSFRPDSRMTLRDRQPFYKGQYFGYAQPWGGARVPVLRWWTAFSDSIKLDPTRFPDATTLMWRWPWHAPPQGGVWGYDVVAFGNYDGAKTEAEVTPRRVRQITALRQAFAWHISSATGDANLLTEFYLRSDPNNADSKLLEVGWLLHAPPSTAGFATSSKPVGTFVDHAGRPWTVWLNERYCMFLPADHRDVLSGEIDMLAALNWLRAKHLVTGEEWFTGVALGVEPLWGVGHAQVDHWRVVYR